MAVGGRAPASVCSAARPGRATVSRICLYASKSRPEFPSAPGCGELLRNTVFCAEKKCRFPLPEQPQTQNRAHFDQCHPAGGWHAREGVWHAQTQRGHAYTARTRPPAGRERTNYKTCKRSADTRRDGKHGALAAGRQGSGSGVPPVASGLRAGRRVQRSEFRVECGTALKRW